MFLVVGLVTRDLRTLSTKCTDPRTPCTLVYVGHVQNSAGPLKQTQSESCS